MQLAYQFTSGEVRRYTVDLFFRLSDLTSSATILCTDTVEGEEPWVVHRKLRAFRRPNPLMDGIMPELMDLVGAPGQAGPVIYTRQGPESGSGFRFPEGPIEVGSSWTSEKLRLKRLPARPKDGPAVARLQLAWAEPGPGDLRGQLVVSAERGLILGVQTLNSWAAGGSLTGHVLVQTRLRECKFLDGSRVNGPTQRLLGF